MSGTWKPANHTIGDFKDWQMDNKLIMKPAYQRNAVWNQTSRIMLIDTILKNYPIPKIFIQNARENNKTVRKIIDGQQRMNAILDYINNVFSLDDPYEGIYQNLSFDDLPDTLQENILQYTIDCNEAYGYTDEEYREIYTRLNKYTIPLNKQELRKAEFPGNFYRLSEKIANLSILENWKIFTLASRRRLLDVEFISEILAGLLKGPQEKKQTLDDFYRRYNKVDLKELETRIKLIINEIDILFPDDGIARTRFKQKADFYSLVLALDSFVDNGLSLSDKEITFLQEDFRYLDKYIEPYDEDSGVTILNEYALRCIGSANSMASRKWRAEFLKLILSGTYLDNMEFIETFNYYKDDPYLNQFLGFYDLGDPSYIDSGMCPLGTSVCSLCHNELDLDDYEWILVWFKDKPMQLSNLKVAHKEGFNPDQHIRLSKLTYKGRLNNKSDNSNTSSKYRREITYSSGVELDHEEFIEDLFKGIDDD